MTMKLEMMEKTLQDLFGENRIVFWYDDKKELRDAFEALQLGEIEKVEMQGNEFAVKHRLLLEKPAQKFLVYQEGPKPPAEENWMLDLLYCCGEFRTDKCSIVLHELGLDPSFSGLYHQHSSFFTNGNKEKLKQKNAPFLQNDQKISEKQVLMNMLSVCCKAENAKLDTIMHELFAEYANDKSGAYQAIEKANLTPFLWDQIEQYYGFRSKVPKIKDFLYCLFKSTLEKALGKVTELKQDSVALLHSFRDLQQYAQAFRTISSQCCHDLQLFQIIQSIPFENLGTIDYCKDIDQKILDQMLEQILKETLPIATIQEVIKNRQLSVWFADFEPAYLALEAAGKFFALLHTLQFRCSTFAEGIDRYSKNWFQVDLCYRQYYTHLKRLVDEEHFMKLTEKIENHYLTSFLVLIHESWQKQLESVKEWKGTLQFPLQRNFFSQVIEQEFASTRNLKHVIVSDALRYEAGWQLYKEAMKIDKVVASISPMVSQLPSYTQLGMAALLPGNELEIGSKNTVLLDGKPTAGMQARNAILETVGGSAIRGEEFLGFSTAQRKEFLDQHRIVYIYQNRIDATGHDTKTESQAFGAVQETIDEIVLLVRKLITAKRSNIFVTADHGFLYQQTELATADFNTDTPSDKDILHTDRRFVIAPSLSESSSTLSFTAAALGLKGSYEVAFPKSITRFRLSGSCSRFVHGGTSLQEIVIPVVKINYSAKREGPSDVEYQLDASTSYIISTSTIALNFSQIEAIDASTRPVQIKVELVAENGDPISDAKEIVFDSTSEQFSQRRKSITLTLSSAANQHNNETVNVVITKRIPNTSQYTEVKRLPYTLKRTFIPDF